MTRTLSRLFVFPRGPSRILPRTNFATKQAHLCSSVRASSSSNENDDIHRIFRQKFISDDDDAQLFECAKTFSARDFTDIISEYNPDILGRKKKNQAKLGKGIWTRVEFVQHRAFRVLGKRKICGNRTGVFDLARGI